MSEIENNIPMPTVEEKPKRKPRARKQAVAKKKTAPDPAKGLKDALKFISVAQKKVGPPQNQFCFIGNNWIVAFDGVIMAAHPIEEDLNACPHTYQLIDALSKVGDELAITQLSEGTLAITSGAFRALVPCTLAADLDLATSPDPLAMEATDAIKDALAAVAPASVDGSPTAAYAGVLLQTNTAVATNGVMLVEAWHGINLPAKCLIPKAAVVAVTKAPYALTGIGGSQSSVTFYFENGAMIKTQLYEENYPSYAHLIEAEGLHPLPIPDDFFKAVKAVRSFSKAGHIFFGDSAVKSEVSEDFATTHKIEGVPNGMGFQADLLLSVESIFEKAHFDEASNRVFFFGSLARGVIMALDTDEVYQLAEGQE